MRRAQQECYSVEPYNPQLKLRAQQFKGIKRSKR